MARLASTRFWRTCCSSAGPARRMTFLRGLVNSSPGSVWVASTTLPSSRPRAVWQITFSFHRSSSPAASNV
jgi:hypothetical protein